MDYLKQVEWSKGGIATSDNQRGFIGLDCGSRKPQRSLVASKTHHKAPPVCGFLCVQLPDDDETRRPAGLMWGPAESRTRSKTTISRMGRERGFSLQAGEYRRAPLHMKCGLEIKISKKSFLHTRSPSLAELQ